MVDSLAKLRSFLIKKKNYSLQQVGNYNLNSPCKGGQTLSLNCKDFNKNKKVKAIKKKKKNLHFTFTVIDHNS